MARVKRGGGKGRNRSASGKDRGAGSGHLKENKSSADEAREADQCSMNDFANV